jgi:hypothetical protein
MRAGSATGLQARSVDESYPREFGIPGEETIGPGGLACADRTIGALRPFWAQVARRARAALVINLTNLADIVQRAARTEVGLRIVTVCDSPLGLLDSVACRRWWSIEGQGGGFRSPQFHQVPAGQGLKLSQDASGRSSDVRFWGRCGSRSWSAPASSRPRKPRDTPLRHHRHARRHLNRCGDADDRHHQERGNDGYLPGLRRCNVLRHVYVPSPLPHYPASVYAWILFRASVLAVFGFPVTARA